MVNWYKYYWLVYGSDIWPTFANKPLQVVFKVFWARLFGTCIIHILLSNDIGKRAYSTDFFECCCHLTIELECSIKDDEHIWLILCHPSCSPPAWAHTQYGWCPSVHMDVFVWLYMIRRTYTRVPQFLSSSNDFLHSISSCNHWCICIVMCLCMFERVVSCFAKIQTLSETICFSMYLLVAFMFHIISIHYTAWFAYDVVQFLPILTSQAYICPSTAAAAHTHTHQYTLVRAGQNGLACVRIIVHHNVVL